MKLGIAGIVGVFAGGMFVMSCSASNVKYAADLQGCIAAARTLDAGTQLAAYNACADSLDKDGGK
jgi:hypothetical protein